MNLLTGFLVFSDWICCLKKIKQNPCSLIEKSYEKAKLWGEITIVEQDAIWFSGAICVVNNEKNSSVTLVWNDEDNSRILEGFPEFFEKTKIPDFQFVFQMGELHFCACVARHLRVLGSWFTSEIVRTSFFLVLNRLRMQYVQDIQAVFDPGNIYFFSGRWSKRGVVLASDFSFKKIAKF